jgi:hypothetical protein
LVGAEEAVPPAVDEIRDPVRQAFDLGSGKAVSPRSNGSSVRDLWTALTSHDEERNRNQPVCFREATLLHVEATVAHDPP